MRIPVMYPCPFGANMSKVGGDGMRLRAYAQRKEWMKVYTQTLRCVYENLHINMDTGAVGVGEVID